MYASAHALGATLSHRDDESALLIVMCISHNLISAERNYPILTTVYHQQTNGKAEHTNQTIKQLLRAAHCECCS